MIIRPANDADLEKILGLAHALARHENDPTAQNILATFKVYVAEDQQIVGFAAVDGHQLVALYVSGGWRRSGIGTKLVRAVVQHISELSVLVSANNLPAQAFSAA